uniref:Uncharacterized protein n=1 Tax=Siphoviridae sp. ctWDo30 TaxID=2826360 RepID=A0A8S5N504_9CAUD|nr:MAG TPA: hypothetical protein [Siphoviridae sp. ctWDo30]
MKKIAYVAVVVSMLIIAAIKIMAYINIAAM